MVIAIDAGNTNIHWGWFEGRGLVRRAVCPSRGFNAVKGVAVLRSAASGKRRLCIEGAVVVSVSPLLTRRIMRCLARAHVGIKPLIVSSRLKSPLKYGYRQPRTLGADRIANAVGALTRYKTDLVVIAGGTATVIDVIFRNGWFPGGLIAPGIETGLWALVRKTALLKTVRLIMPGQTLGRSTAECLRCGVLLGQALMIRSLLGLIARQYKRKFLCIATGGWGKFIASHVREIAGYDRDLSLHGALELYYRNKIQ